MSHSRNKLPLGAVLQQAGLVSSDQVKDALTKQKQINNSLRIGEILASQGYINPKTADFFAESLSTLREKQPKQPIGQYFKQAALLNEQQLRAILNEQKQTKVKFGELAISKGWLKQSTVDFFLRYLVSQSNCEVDQFSETTSSIDPLWVDNSVISEPIQAPKQSDLNEESTHEQKIHEEFLKIKLKLLKLEDQSNFSEQVLEQVLLWTGGHSFLTQQLFQFLKENSHTNLPGEATAQAEQIDNLVKSQLVNVQDHQTLDNHFKTIEKRLLSNSQCQPSKLLKLYRQVLTKPHSLDGSKEQQELLQIGLVVKQQEKLIVANRIYRSVFDHNWVNRELTNLTTQETSAIAVVPKTSATIVPVVQSKASFFKFKNILIVLALMGLLSLLFNNIVKRITVRKAFQQGNQLLREKAFTQALNEYNALLNIDSNYFQAWTNRGYALAGLQKYEEMRESCSAATIIEPTALYAWNCQGEALHNLGREKEAIEAFDRAIALNANDAIFLINKSESLKAIGKDEESLVSIKKAIQVLEKTKATQGKSSVSGELAVALTFLGNNYRKKQQYQAALKTYDRALEYSPNYFSAQIGKGIVLNRVGRYEAARTEFENILSNTQLSKTRQAQALFYLGKTLCQSQQKSQGIAVFEQAIELQPDYKAAKQAQRRCS